VTRALIGGIKDTAETESERGDEQTLHENVDDGPEADSLERPLSARVGLKRESVRTLKNVGR
jgi:hypothetical protein